MKTRYFHRPKDQLCEKRVIVFKNGLEPGKAYWGAGCIGPNWWYLREMKNSGFIEIIRSKALRIVKKLPK